MAFAIMAIGVLALLTFRYEYISREAGSEGAYLLKVDRFTGHICYITESQRIVNFIDDRLTFVQCGK